MPSQSVVLPLSPASSRLAREFVRSVTQAPEDGRVAVVVTELVTNAVVHARSRPHLTVGLGDHVVTLEVADDSPGRPVMQPLESSETSGRGLALVDQMSDDWGVEVAPDGPGKVVWARVALPRAPTLSSPPPGSGGRV